MVVLVAFLRAAVPDGFDLVLELVEVEDLDSGIFRLYRTPHKLLQTRL